MYVKSTDALLGMTLTFIFPFNYVIFLIVKLGLYLRFFSLLFKVKKMLVKLGRFKMFLGKPQKKLSVAGSLKKITLFAASLILFEPLKLFF